MSRLRTLASTPRADIAPMTEEETKFYINLTFTSISDGDPLLTAEELKETIIQSGEAVGRELPWPVAVFLERLIISGDGLKYSPAVVFWMNYISRNIAEIVMWAYTLVEETRKRGEGITFRAFAEELFPFGFPTEKATSELWDEQKDPSGKTLSIFGWNGDNLIDAPSAWKPDGSPIKTTGIER